MIELIEISIFLSQNFFLKKMLQKKIALKKMLQKIALKN